MSNLSPFPFIRMNISQDHRAWNCSSLLVKLSSFISVRRPGMLASVSFVLALAACSKEKKELKSQAAAAGAPAHLKVLATPAALPKPEGKKAPPVVSPGHLPPSPRVPQSGPSMTEADARNRLLAQPILPEQASPAAAAPSAEPRPQIPAASVHTPEQGNQARLNALQEMFRQRGQKDTPTLPNDGPSSPAKEKSAPAKSNP